MNESDEVIKPKRTTKQQLLINLLKQKGSVDLLDLQKGTHGVRTTNPASLIEQLRRKGYDITTYVNKTEKGKYISTVYKLNSLPLPEDISDVDRAQIESWDDEIKFFKKKINYFKKQKEKILNIYN